MKKLTLFNKEYQKKQSEKYKYKHIHTGEYCTFAAYVAEYLILRRAERLNLPKPSYKFWTKGDPNHWAWLKQFKATTSLAKKYDEEAILRAIKSNDFKNLFFLGVQNKNRWKVNPPVIPIIEKYQKIIDDEKKKESNIKAIEVKDSPTRRINIKSNKKSILNRLRNNGKKETR